MCIPDGLGKNSNRPPLVIRQNLASGTRCQNLLLDSGYFSGAESLASAKSDDPPRFPPRCPTTRRYFNAVPGVGRIGEDSSNMNPSRPRRVPMKIAPVKTNGEHKPLSRWILVTLIILPSITVGTVRAQEDTDAARAQVSAQDRASIYSLSNFRFHIFPANTKAGKASAAARTLTAMPSLMAVPKQVELRAC
jgi:hypothetical protein